MFEAKNARHATGNIFADLVKFYDLKGEQDKADAIKSRAYEDNYATNNAYLKHTLRQAPNNKPNLAKEYQNGSAI